MKEKRVQSSEEGLSFLVLVFRFFCPHKPFGE